MSSGVAVNDECVSIYNEMKLKKNYKYVTFFIEDKKEIKISDKGEASKTSEDFKKSLPEDQPRYGFVDIEYTTDRKQSKLTFVMWSPDDKCSVKDKMLHAPSKDALKKKCTGIMKELQANEMGDLGDKEVNELMNKK